MATIGYTLYSSQVNLMDGRQGIEKSFNPADGSLTQALNGVAGTAGEVQWATGTIQAASQWASTNTDPKMAAALGKIAISLVPNVLVGNAYES
ncbi:MAG: hypothetical protein PHW18_06335 [Sulfuricurvum sp.]|uniref:hypothetical protein n=1 Tax=Sulfuricurvum sp. TaxID=2025608 RepID=UPI002633A012|nr:hypothetical protein [Sulfuricurvum sp.]MDD2829174.1 hypothetical protein [Sulfuricurvum sp.]MDD4950223.1 hypothetical protein [Sulfuricurvum sp.]